MSVSMVSRAIEREEYQIREPKQVEDAGAISYQPSVFGDQASNYYYFDTPDDLLERAAR